MANEDEDLALAIARAIKGVDPTLVNVCMPGLPMEKASETVGLKVVREFFADRAYEDDGTLMSRKKPGAVLHDADAAAERVLRTIAGRRDHQRRAGKRIPRCDRHDLRAWRRAERRRHGARRPRGA